MILNKQAPWLLTFVVFALAGAAMGCGRADFAEVGGPGAQPSYCEPLPDPPGDNIVNLADEGLASGDEIGPYFEEWVRTGNEVHIPAGRYTWNGDGFSTKDELLANASVIGDGEVILDAGDNYDWSSTWDLEAPGTFELRNITVKGTRGGGDNANMRVLVEDPDGTIIFRNFNQPDGANPQSTTPGIFVNKRHVGTFHLIDSHIEGFNDNGLYASAPAKTEDELAGLNGEVHVVRGLFKNNNISNVRIGSDNSSVKGAVIVNDEALPLNGRARNQRGLRVCVEKEGDNITVEDVNITQQIESTNGALVVECEDGGEDGTSGTITGARIQNDVSEDPIRIRPDESNWTGSDIDITGSGNLTPDGGDFSDVCIGEECEAPRTTKPVVCR